MDWWGTTRSRISETSAKGYRDFQSSQRPIDKQTHDIVSNIKTYFSRHPDIQLSNLKVLIDLNEAPNGIETELASQISKQFNATELGSINFVY